MNNTKEIKHRREQKSGMRTTARERARLRIARMAVSLVTPWSCHERQRSWCTSRVSPGNWAGKQAERRGHSRECQTRIGDTWHSRLHEHKNDFPRRNLFFHQNEIGHTAAHVMVRMQWARSPSIVSVAHATWNTPKSSDLLGKSGQWMESHKKRISRSNCVCIRGV